MDIVHRLIEIVLGLTKHTKSKSLFIDQSLYDSECAQIIEKPIVIAVIRYVDLSHKFILPEIGFMKRFCEVSLGVIYFVENVGCKT